jgi:hypothetical protein
MMSVMEIKMVKDSNNFSQREIEICCAISSRFTNNDLFNAAHQLSWYKRDPNNQFMKDGVRELIIEMEQGI